MEKKNDIEKALKWAFDNLLDKEYYCPAIQQYVRFNVTGIKHAIKARTYPNKIKAIYNVVDLLQNAEKYSDSSDKKNRKDITHVWKLKSKTMIDNKEKIVFIILREEKDGKIYYDHEVMK